MNIEQAKEIANAVEWSGDVRVNFMTAWTAASCLAKRLDELETKFAKEILKHDQQQELKAIRDKYTERGFASHWCESCGTFTFNCRECGANSCGGGTKGCNLCEVTFRQMELFWEETNQLLDDMFNA